MTWKTIKLTYYIFYILAIGTVLLLGFVIPHGGYVVDEPDDPQFAGSVQPLSYPTELPSVLETGVLLGEHIGEHVIIKVYRFEMFGSEVFAADVIVRDPRLIMSGLAKNLFGGQNQVETVRKMAEDRNAVFAVNADFASVHNSGFVIKNGQVLRRTRSGRDAVALYRNGTVENFHERDKTIDRLFIDGAWQVFSFGPALVKNHVMVADASKYNMYTNDNPRTAFGWVEDFRYLFVVVDGRRADSIGVDVEELAIIMQSLGAKEAYNFDGGGSTTMYFNGEVVNTPSQGSEREVSDCVYIRG